MAHLRVCNSKSAVTQKLSQNKVLFIHTPRYKSTQSIRTKRGSLCMFPLTTSLLPLVSICEFPSDQTICIFERDRLSCSQNALLVFLCLLASLSALTDTLMKKDGMTYTNSYKLEFPFGLEKEKPSPLDRSPRKAIPQLYFSLLFPSDTLPLSLFWFLFAFSLTAFFLSYSNFLHLGKMISE